MTSSFSDKGRAAVLDRPAEISSSEIQFAAFSMKSIAHIFTPIPHYKHKYCKYPDTYFRTLL